MEMFVCVCESKRERESVKYLRHITAPGAPTCELDTKLVFFLFTKIIKKETSCSSAVSQSPTCACHQGT